MQDRRNERRSFCADLIEVTWSEGGRTYHRVANLEDISAAGVCLMMESALPVGCDVAVCLDGMELLYGVVRHTTLGEAGVLLGISFHPGSEWSSDAFQPRHMLDPMDLFPVSSLNRDKR